MLVRQYLIMTILFIWNEQLHLKLLDRKALEEKREIKEIKEIMEKQKLQKDLYKYIELVKHHQLSQLEDILILKQEN